MDACLIAYGKSALLEAEVARERIKTCACSGVGCQAKQEERMNENHPAPGMQHGMGMGMGHDIGN